MCLWLTAPLQHSRLLCICSAPIPTPTDSKADLPLCPAPSNACADICANIHAATNVSAHVHSRPNCRPDLRPQISATPAAATADEKGRPAPAAAAAAGCQCVAGRGQRCSCRGGWRRCHPIGGTHLRWALPCLPSETCFSMCLPNCI